jgi:hypothetical protein
MFESSQSGSQAQAPPRPAAIAVAVRRERQIRSGPVRDHRRLAELRKIAEDAREAGEVSTFHDSYGKGQTLFLTALPHMLACPVITKRGLPAAGDLAQFAYDHCRTFYRVAGGAPYFDRLREAYDSGRLPKPHRLKADEAAKRLRITLSERQRLGLTTIGADDRTKKQRAQDRKDRDRANKAEARKRAGARPRDESASRTKPWEAFGWSRSTWDRRGKPAYSQADENSSTAGDVVSYTSGRTNFRHGRHPTPIATFPRHERRCLRLRAPVRSFLRLVIPCRRKRRSIRFQAAVSSPSPRLVLSRLSPPAPCCRSAQLPTRLLSTLLRHGFVVTRRWLLSRLLTLDDARRTNTGWQNGGPQHDDDRRDDHRSATGRLPAPPRASARRV